MFVFFAWIEKCNVVSFLQHCLTDPHLTGQETPWPVIMTSCLLFSNILKKKLDLQSCNNVEFNVKRFILKVEVVGEGDVEVMEHFFPPLFLTF